MVSQIQGCCPEGAVALSRELDKAQEAREAADEILASVFGLSVARKAALDLSSAQGFDRAVGLLAAALRRSSARLEREAVKEALSVLRVDWRSTTAQQRRRLVNDSLVAAGRKLALVPAAVEVDLRRFSPDAFRAGRRDARRHGLRIAATFTEADKRAARILERSNALFVTDEMRRRHDAFGAEARRIVAEGLEQGLGRVEIGERLSSAAAGTVARSGAYWEVVAGAFLGRARSASQLAGYREAGVRWYRIDAVLDEATTNICRYLHGRTFKVSEGLALLRREGTARAPEAVKAINPWVRERRAKDGRRELYVGSGDRERRIATVEESAFGVADEIGRFSGGLDDAGLMDEGVGFPPYHGLCRSTTIPVL